MQLPVEKLVSKQKAPPVAEALKHACKERLSEYVTRYQREGVPLAMPTIGFDLRGKVGGKAYLRLNHIQLNAVLLTENPAEYLGQVIGHETAHLATLAKFGRARVAPHGVEWQSMMRLIGLVPHRTHAMDTTNSRVQQAKHRYACACAETMLTTRRHNLIRKLRKRLICKACRQDLVYRPSGPLAPQVLAPKPVSAPAPLRQRIAGPFQHSGGAALTKLPTDAMVLFAKKLALEKGMLLMPSTLISFEQTSAFIAAAKQLPSKAALDARQPVDAPTDKQLAFATQVAVRTGKRIPSDALVSKRALSEWLTRITSK